MRPTLHPRLVNGRFGDPALFVEALHTRDALLFDLGELSPLSARDLLRVTHVFVSHMHMDHFIGFDTLLRISVGRDRRIAIVGPTGIAACVGHKLHGYTWDLVEKYDTDLVFDVSDFDGERLRDVRFRFKQRFRREEMGERESSDAVVAREPGFAVTAAVLEHHGDSLGFAVAEPLHVNVWRNRLDERGLPTGAWLVALKQAVRDGLGDETPIRLPDGSTAPLGALRDLVSVEPGQKIGYVTDVADTPANRAAIAALTAKADTLFIESRFRAADKAQADARAHLTTRTAGEIARAAQVRRVEPFHFSPRYEGEEDQMIGEVRTAFEQSEARAAELSLA